MRLIEAHLRKAKEENVRRLARFLGLTDENKTLDQLIEKMRFPLNIPNFNSLFGNML